MMVWYSILYYIVMYCTALYYAICYGTIPYYAGTLYAEPQALQPLRQGPHAACVVCNSTLQVSANLYTHVHTCIHTYLLTYFPTCTLACMETITLAYAAYAGMTAELANI